MKRKKRTMRRRKKTKKRRRMRKKRKRRFSSKKLNQERGRILMRLKIRCWNQLN